MGKEEKEKEEKREKRARKKKSKDKTQELGHTLLPSHTRYHSCLILPPSICPARVGYLLPFLSFSSSFCVLPATLHSPHVQCSQERERTEAGTNAGSDQRDKRDKGMEFLSPHRSNPIDISSSIPFSLANQTKLYTFFELFMSCMLLPGQVTHAGMTTTQNSIGSFKKASSSHSHTLTKQEVKNKHGFLFRVSTSA